MASDDEDEQQAGDDHAGPTSSADEAEFVAEEAPQTNWAVHDVARLPDGGFAIVTLGGGAQCYVSGSSFETVWDMFEVAGDWK